MDTTAASPPAAIDPVLRDLDVVSAYWPLFCAQLVSCLRELLATATEDGAPGHRAVARGHLYRALFAEGRDPDFSFSGAVLTRILASGEHPYLVQAAGTGPQSVPPFLRRQMGADLRRWQRVAQALDARLGLDRRGGVCPPATGPAFCDPLAPPPPSWSALQARHAWLQATRGAGDWGRCVEVLGDLVHRYGLGSDQGCAAFRFEADASDARLEPIRHLAAFDLDGLEGAHEGLAVVEDNTRNLLDGFRAHNILIWGPRGCGKSSLIRGLLVRYAARGLRGVEISPATYPHLRRLFPLVRHRRERFLAILDNIALEGVDAATRSLSTTLDGGLEEIPANLVFYATSNFKDLVDRCGEKHQGPPPLQSDAATEDRLRPHEAAPPSPAFDPQGFARLDERRALDDRFALKVFVDMPTKTQYDRLVLAYARRVGLDEDAETLLADFQRWRLQHNHDLIGGRTARDYVLARYPDFVRGQSSPG